MSTTMRENRSQSSRLRRLAKIGVGFAATALFAPAVMATSASDEPFAVALAIATVLYPSASGGSLARCVESTAERRSQEIRAQVSEAATLPTKSRQKEAVEKLVAAQKMVPFSARAECLAIVHMYLEYASGADGSSGRNAIDEVRKTAGDLTTVGRSDLSFLLGNYSKGAVTRCGPWLTGDDFRKYSTDDQVCAAWLQAAAEQNMMMNLRVNVFAAQFEGLAKTYFAGLRGCYETDQYRNLMRADAEERWNAACRFAAAVGLATENVSAPDFASLKTQEEPAAPVVRPPTTQGRGARITRPRIPWSANDSGTVQLEIFVQENGRPGEVKVKSSSGSPSFDESAVKEVKANWLLGPGTVDGVPTAMWHTVGVSFKRD